MLSWFRRRRESVVTDEITPVDITADEFAARLEAIAPSNEQLAKAGLSESAAERFRRLYVCRRLSNSDETDPLLDLCSNFDVSSTDICSLTFCRPTELDGLPFHRPRNFVGDFWMVGYLESDPILYPKARGPISMRSHEDLACEAHKCARTPQGFLAALLVAAEYSTQRSRLDIEDTQTPAAARQALGQCLSFAGSETKSFYCDLMGIY